MKRLIIGLSSALGACAAVLACSSDDTVAPPPRGGGSDGASADSGNGGDDGEVIDAGGDAGDGGRWLLLSIGDPAKTEAVAYNLSSRTVDGRLSYDGFGTTFVDDAADPSGAGSPKASLWNLEQQSDIVRRLDPNAPWQSGPSWNVRLEDRPAGGSSYADPVAVVSGPAGKAYVLRFNRNALAVIDTTEQKDASAPVKTIDLSRFVDPVDGDGIVDMTGAVYLPARKRLYVLLGNIDLKNVDPQGSFILCNAAKPRIVAIDVASDTIVPALDGGAGEALAFDGYNPVFNGLTYDVPRDRLLVLSAGCNDRSDAGTGALHKRQIDAIDPNTGAAETLLDLTSKGYPSARVRTDASHWAIGFGFGAEAYRWDVTSKSLGGAIPNALDVFAYDARQSLVGTKTNFLADGGSSTSLVSIELGNGSVTTLGPVPFSSTNQFPPGAVDYWSPPR